MELIQNNSCQHSFHSSDFDWTGIEFKEIQSWKNTTAFIERKRYQNKEIMVSCPQCTSCIATVPVSFLVTLTFSVMVMGFAQWHTDLSFNTRGLAKGSQEHLLCKECIVQCAQETMICIFWKEKDTPLLKAPWKDHLPGDIKPFC